jgi:ABC-type thiamin/hydroxymethylpyrimidine transport system permease subunit
MWAAFVKSFHNSETIFWSRLQVVVGVLLPIVFTVVQVVTSTDLSPLFSNPKILVGWLIINGLLQEFLRRHREDWGPHADEPHEDGHAGDHS